jgi:hypothetical protein
METKAVEIPITALDTETEKAHDSANGLIVPEKTTVAEASAEIKPLNFTADDILKAVDSTLLVQQSGRRGIASRTLIDSLPAKSRDIPDLMNGSSVLPTRLSLKKFNDDRTLIVYDSTPAGEGYTLHDASDIVTKFYSAGMKLAKDRYRVFIDIESSKEHGWVKIPKTGMAGLDVTQLDTLSCNDVFDVDMIIDDLKIRRGDEPYTLRMPVLMHKWDADRHENTRKMTLENLLSGEGTDRMDSMRKMMAFDPTIQPLTPHQLTGEYVLAMATGYGSPLWKFPNVNGLLTATALNYLPLFKYTERSASADLIMLGKNNQRSDIGSTFSAVTPNDANQLDMMRIVAAMMFPQQIKLVMDTSDASDPADLLGAILSKLFLSTTRGFANIDISTARQIDGMIGRFLTANKYLRKPNSDYPLDLTHSRQQNSAWSELTTSEVELGSGWINHETHNPFVVPDFEHDYAARISVPQYADVVRTPIFDEHNVDVARTTPMLSKMLEAASEISTPNLNSLASILSIRKEAYVAFLSMLNDYMYRFTFNSFRATDDVREDLHSGKPDRLNDPLMITIKPRAFVAFWKFMPCRFKAPIEVMQLPIIESKIETELAIYQVTHDRVRKWVDEHNLTDVLKRKQIAQIAAKVSASDLMVAIIALASGDPYNELLFRDIGRNPDEMNSPFALFLDEVYDSIDIEPELIGYTYNYVWKSEDRSTYTGTVRDLRDNTQMISDVKDWTINRRLDLQETLRSANSGRLISDVLIANNRIDNGMIGFKTPVPVVTTVNEVYEKDIDAILKKVVNVKISTAASVSPSESVQIGVLSDRYVVPSLRYSQWPDSHVLEYPRLNDWYTGGRRAISITRETIYEYRSDLLVYSGIRTREAITTLTKPRDLERSSVEGSTEV